MRRLTFVQENVARLQPIYLEFIRCKIHRFNVSKIKSSFKYVRDPKIGAHVFTLMMLGRSLPPQSKFTRLSDGRPAPIIRDDVRLPPLARKFASDGCLEQRAAPSVEIIARLREGGFAVGDFSEQFIDPRHDSALFSLWCERNKNIFQFCWFNACDRCPVLRAFVENISLKTPQYEHQITRINSFVRGQSTHVLINRHLTIGNGNRECVIEYARAHYHQD